MSWGEAVRLVSILRADPSSMLAAAMEGWAYPFSRTEALLADLYDLEYAKAGVKRPKPYPRPYKAVKQSTRRGDVAGRTNAEVIDILRGRGESNG